MRGGVEPFNLLFQSPFGEVVKETIPTDWDRLIREKFQSPFGEVVKETGLYPDQATTHYGFNPLSGKW